MHGRLYSLEGAKHELVEHFLAAKVVGVSRAEEQDVGGDDAELARPDGLDRRDDDVEEGGELVERKHKHLVRLAAVPHERVRNALDVVRLVLVLLLRGYV